MTQFRVAVLITFFSFIIFFLINIPAPIAVSGDGVFYYGWAHSIIFDHDINLVNQLEYFSQYDFYSNKFTKEHILTDTGYTPNPYGFGSAILWIPFILFAHIINMGMHIFGLNFFELDGYSSVYMYAVNFASWIFGMISIFMLYRILIYYFDRKISFFTVCGMWLATPFVYYQFFEPSMSHVTSFMMVSIFFLYIIKIIHNQKISYVLFGIIVFLMISVRWQNILFIFAMIPLFYYYFSQRDKGMYVMTIIFICSIFVIIQSFIWKAIYGAYLLIPQGNDFVGRSFYFLDTLFSTNRGLFLWSPIFIFSLVGTYYLFQKNKYVAVTCILAILFQWFINSVLSDPGGGDAFGARRFMGAVPFFGVLFGAFADYMLNKKFVVMLIFLVLWNAVLMQNYRMNKIPHHGEFDALNIKYFQFF